MSKSLLGFLQDRGVSAPAALLAGMVLLTACASVQAGSGPTTAEAVAFTRQAESDLARSSEYLNRADWVHSTYLNSDTDWLYAKALAENTTLAVRYAVECRGRQRGGHCCP